MRASVSEGMWSFKGSIVTDHQLSALIKQGRQVGYECLRSLHVLSHTKTHT